MREQIEEWQSTMGINAISKDTSEVSKILAMAPSEVEGSSVGELRHYLLTLSYYKVFLVWQVGQIKSYVDYYGSKLNYKCDSLSGTYQAYSREERQALAIKNDPQLLTIFDKLQEYQLKYNQLRNLPDAIQVLMDKIDRLEFRKSKEL